MAKGETGQDPMHVDGFRGDFDFMPFAAHLLFGALPTHPTESDFALAVTDMHANPGSIPAMWRLEAIRERRVNPGRLLVGEVLQDINRRAAEWAYRYAEESR